MTFFVARLIELPDLLAFAAPWRRGDWWLHRLSKASLIMLLLSLSSWRNFVCPKLQSLGTNACWWCHCLLSRSVSAEKAGRAEWREAHQNKHVKGTVTDGTPAKQAEFAGIEFAARLNHDNRAL